MSPFDLRCCLRCGRWGVRAFRPADDGAEGYVCTNDRACGARVPSTSDGESDAALRDRIHEAATTAINSVYGTDDRHAYMGLRIAQSVVDATPLPWNYDFQGEALRVPSTSEGEGT